MRLKELFWIRQTNQNEVFGDTNCCVCHLATGLMLIFYQFSLKSMFPQLKFCFHFSFCSLMLRLRRLRRRQPRVQRHKCPRQHYLLRSQEDGSAFNNTSQKLRNSLRTWIRSIRKCFHYGELSHPSARQCENIWIKTWSFSMSTFLRRANDSWRLHKQADQAMWAMQLQPFVMPIRKLLRI